MVVLAVLIGGAVLASGLVELYFSYRENKAALVEIEHGKAVAAATRIEAFIGEIERQVGWTILPRLGPTAVAMESRRFDYLRLLRQAPAITEVSYLDGAGREQLRVSRLAIDVQGSGTDLSREPKFLRARAEQTYHGPVYFRKESEPYMTIAIAGGAGDPGVTVAEVNLKFILDVVSQIKVGQAGRAYVVDGAGTLIAHPDISLVLQKTSLATLPQVEAVVAGREPTPIAWDLRHKAVLTSYAPIASLRWFVFLEQPIGEALAPLRASIERTALLILLGIALAVVASVVLARRMVTPIRALQSGAARIGAGDLAYRIHVPTGDELEALGARFNSMAEQLQESYAGLERKVEERTRELTEALEQQTATAEILRVIAGSPTDVQPVLETLVVNAVKLADAAWGHVRRYDGEFLRIVAHHNQTPDSVLERIDVPVRPDRTSAVGTAFLERRSVHIVDTAARTEYQGPANRAGGTWTVLAVPMLREGVPIGTLSLVRSGASPFSAMHMQAVTTFADQAVIAIENVRLFTELEERTRALSRSVVELRALGEVGQAVSSSLDLETVLETIVTRASELSQADGGAIYEYDQAAEAFHLRATRNFDAAAVEVMRARPIAKGEGLLGRVAEARTPQQIADILADKGYRSPLRDVLVRAGSHALLAVPLLREEQIIGGLVVNRNTPGEFPAHVIELLTAFATQSALAIQNARLFREIDEKSRQLEIANRHKSEFLANMSHELRTPLNAIIGFSEVLLERMFGELNDKQAEYLDDVLSSGRHLLSLINDILDLSKVEAGRMELEVTSFDLPQAVENAVALVRGRAAAHTIRMNVAVDERLGSFAGDERKVKQILLNLLSNAVKFTPDGGAVHVTATQVDGAVEIAVRDTGIGIGAEDQAVIFEEFRQVRGSAGREREGTGLGLALTKRFVELHEGTIRVDSAIGHGATFTVRLPVRPWPTN